MKFCICLFFTIITITAISQSSLSYSAVLKNTSGEKVDVKTIQNSGKPLILDFWASWCKPCSKYNSLKDVYKTWQEETGVRIVSISIDNERELRKPGNCTKKRMAF
jgi:cytochrome c biogenesis protein CcmG/thiol:disulfide interchange protein DsbE